MTLTGDEQVRALNAQWRGKDKPTNVLSFPLTDEENLSQAKIAGPELLLGDIILARGVCTAEAAEKDHLSVIAIADHDCTGTNRRRVSAQLLYPRRTIKRPGVRVKTTY